MTIMHRSPSMPMRPAISPASTDTPYWCSARVWALVVLTIWNRLIVDALSISCSSNMAQYSVLQLPRAIFVDVHLTGHDLGYVKAQIITQVDQDDENIRHLPCIQ